MRGVRGEYDIVAFTGIRPPTPSPRFTQILFARPGPICIQMSGNVFWWDDETSKALLIPYAVYANEMVGGPRLTPRASNGGISRIPNARVIFNLAGSILGVDKFSLCTLGETASEQDVFNKLKRTHLRWKTIDLSGGGAGT
tara:strand:+ start:721 stop:1143 length:423 start_codon:yes stop_codon:yes gene_type:complete